MGVAYGRVCAVLTLACVASLATSASGGGFGVGVTVGGHERTSSSSSSAPRDGSRSPLLVSLLDGTVQAVDRATGEAMWSFSSGGPLVRAHAAATVDDEDPSASSSSSGAVRPARGRPSTVFPGVDGSLYTLSGGDRDGADAVVTRLPVTARQLVDASPSMTRDGAVVVGERKSVVFALSASTGALLRTFAADGTVVHGASDDEDDRDAFLLGEDDREGIEPGDELRDAVFLGRTEYAVRSVDAATGLERWNVSYGELHPLTRAPGTGTGTGTGTLFLPGSGVGVGDGNGDDGDGDFELGPGNAIRSRDGGWSARLPSVPLGAFDRRTGRAVGAFGRGVRGTTDILDPSVDQEIVVGAHAGGLYALPKGSVGFEDGGGSGAGSGSGTGSGGLVSRASSTFPVSVSARASDDDWACIPEELAARVLATRGNPYLAAVGAAIAIAGGGGGGDASVAAYAFFTLAAGVGAVVTYASMVMRRRGVPATPARAGAKRGSRGGKRGRRNRGGGEVKGEVADPVADPVAEQVADPDAEQVPSPRAETVSERASNDDTSTKAVSSPPPRSSVRPLTSGATRVGRLEVGPGVLGYGSCGTIVFEGRLDGRAVAVKRLLAQFHELARSELATLIASDEHPNVLRCYAMEEDADFAYVALERCSFTLASLVDGTLEGTPPFHIVDPTTRLPTKEGTRVMRDACAGLLALHARGIVHRDLKPANVLVTDAGRGKLADMGLAKRLNLAEGTSFETNLAATPGGGGGAGTAGWQAPERLRRDGRLTRAVDTFSLGCMLHYCLSGGGHPFGERYERDANVSKGAEPNLVPLGHMPEAADLVWRLVRADPAARGTAAFALAHPFWWNAEKRLGFLNDVSDRVELEDREHCGHMLLVELERGASRALGGDWVSKLNADILQHLGRYRRYKGDEVRDLLRVIRNKSNHYRELPTKLREEMGSMPEGFLRYFASKFPFLLLHAYDFARRECAHEPQFRKYFYPEPAERDSLGEAAAAAADTHADAIAAASRARAAARAERVKAAPPIVYPQRPGAQDCEFYVKTGRCKFGVACHFNHPPGIHD